MDMVNWGFGHGWTVLLFWALLILAIAVLVKYLSSGREESSNRVRKR